MYGELITFNLGPQMASTAEALADHFSAALTNAQGLRSKTFFVDHSTGECGAFFLWDSKEDFEAKHQVVGPELEKALSGIIKEPPFLKLYEVYEPKA